MYDQTMALHARTATSARRHEQSSDAAELPTWVVNGLLILASVVLLVLAGASAWLSYHAQVDYVLAHNGNKAPEARVWALLLDAGTAGVSMLRLYEALRRRRGASTCLTLASCIGASVAMNVLHTPSHNPGGYLVAAIPPLMYAVFLEHLLANLRNLLTKEEMRRGTWRTFVLWLNFPSMMWRTWRAVLRHAAEPPRPERVEEEQEDTNGALCAAPAQAADEEPAQTDAPRKNLGKRADGFPCQGRGRGPGPKRVAFESALAQQVALGDLRLFSVDERERNAAAYDAAASLPAPLSRGTARRYVVQALPRLGANRAANRRADADALLAHPPECRAESSLIE
ncbi:DUF2637 domain-containing protein [Actinospica sp. MGRD01-02]|uniref:DUF2637 domain-containing protein n=1 Tax=Actinospica acidithermotolerans TaxID=2828514 RepID=A0A941E9S3_9ACTN|nr:DUF2637 domain-containing protein [Actinospica acidithermotolerans]MBR7827581.1 DUF2637 domain-containing protein [Actinospica acidithermotolerans]